MGLGKWLSHQGACGTKHKGLILDYQYPVYKLGTVTHVCNLVLERLLLSQARFISEFQVR